MREALRCAEWTSLAFVGCKPDAPAHAPAPPPNGSANGSEQGARRVALPGGEHGIGFDDLRYAAAIGKVVAPAGGTGTLDLVEPATGAVTSIEGFGTASATRGHENGTTSADEGAGYLFAIDRTQLALSVIDERSHAIVGSAPLASSPDYVRWVEATHELWVTEPDEDRIEVFSLDDAKPRHAAFIAVAGGPESLVIAGARAFTHLWEGKTVAIDVTSRAITATWPNGCEGSRGIALDARRNWLFAGCAEGKATVVDVQTGTLLGSLAVGAGVDVIDFNPRLSHLYVPSARTATLSFVGASAGGQLALLGTAPTSPGAHCVTADAADRAWVCDVRDGALIGIADRYPASE
jgi:DNA-binding beta-propeller fold protein YncE